MTIVLVVDPNSDTRYRLQSDLVNSNQFERVLCCEGFAAAKPILESFLVKVMLLDAALAQDQTTLKTIKDEFPALGVVILQDTNITLDLDALQDLGAHAQASRLASPMELMASVAKALVARLRPSTKILRKLLKD